MKYITVLDIKLVSKNPIKKDKVLNFFGNIVCDSLFLKWIKYNIEKYCVNNIIEEDKKEKILRDYKEFLKNLDIVHLFFEEEKLRNNYKNLSNIINIIFGIRLPESDVFLINRRFFRILLIETKDIMNKILDSCLEDKRKEILKEKLNLNSILISYKEIDKKYNLEKGEAYKIFYEELSRCRKKSFKYHADVKRLYDSIKIINKYIITKYYFDFDYEKYI